MSTALRLQRLIAVYGAVIAAALVVVGVVALFGAWSAFTAMPTQQETVEINQQTVGTSLDSEAVVTGNSSLYEQGRVLRNSPVYFLEANPFLTLVLNTTGPADEPLTVNQSVTLEFRATRDGEAFWSERRPIMSREETTTDGLVQSTTSVNVTLIRDLVAEKRSAVSDVGILQSNLVVRVQYETGRYSGSFTAETSFVFSERAYWLAEDVAESRDHSETVTRTVAAETNPLEWVGPALLGLVALLGAAGVVLYQQRLDALSIQTQLYRSRYEEWISDGEFPTGTEKKYVRINSLEDLVDVAIDTNKRVLYDEELDIYAVIDADIIFYFSTDPVSVDSWLDV